MLLVFVVATLNALGGIPPALAAPKSGKTARTTRTPLTHDCSRSYSRIVRRRFEREISRFLPGNGKKGEIRWPAGCPFHHEVDLWGRHERAKVKPASKKPGSSEWVCGFSGKVFKSEHYLDLHLERRYMNETPGDGGVCLEQYCEMFEFCKVDDSNSWYDSLNPEPPSCDPVQLANWGNECSSVMERCFPLTDGIGDRLDEKMSKLLCEPLTCDARAARHHSNRKQMIVTLSVIGVFALLIFLYAVCCYESQPDYSPYSKRRSMTNNMPARRPLNPGRKKLD